LATFPSLTGFVPYTGATADVNLGTHDLAAERGTFANNGSSDTLTVNHTSGSGYGIIVTKGGNNEALYVSKTSGSGNAMTVVGGRTSLVDLALSSVTNTAGDFLTISGGVVHKRTAAQTLTDIGAQAVLTNPVTGTGTTNYLPKFTGSTTIGDSVIADNATEINIPKRIFLNSGGQSIFFTPNLSSASNRIEGSSGVPLEIFTSGSALRFAAGGVSTQITLLSSGNVGIGTTSPDSATNYATLSINGSGGGQVTWQSAGSKIGYVYSTSSNLIIGADASKNLIFDAGATERARITSGGNVLIGTSTDLGVRLLVAGDIATSTRIVVDTINGYNGGSTPITIQTGGAQAIVFGTNATERMRITSGGDLLVNETATVYSSKFTLSYNPSSSNGPIILDNRNLFAANIGGVQWFGARFNSSGNYRPFGGIGAFKENGTDGNSLGYLSLWTNGNAADSTERMRITSGGNVLIGTTTDSGYKLNVNGGIITTTNSVIANTFTFINLENNSSKLNCSRFLAIADNAGSVGIGYNSDSQPVSAKFLVNGVSYFNGASTFTSSVTATKGDFGTPFTSTNLLQALASSATDANLFQVGMVGVSNGFTIQRVSSNFRYIFNDGNVGIGTTAPANKLSVSNSANGVIASFGNNVDADLLINLTSGVTLLTPSTSILAFGTSSTERMRISSGNVLIGTTTDVGAKLYVNGAIRTANPTGSTSNDWLLGRALTSGTSSPDRWIRVQIGNLYYDILAVYMGSV
jgi:hypothetical protein